MSLLPVSLVIFYRQSLNEELEVWVQRREDDGPYHGLQEFPGGKIERDELPLQAAVREVEEEVGIVINPKDGVFMGTYVNESTRRSVLLYVFIFPESAELKDRGTWLKICRKTLSSPYQGQIPAPNHRIIDELFMSLYDTHQ